MISGVIRSITAGIFFATYFDFVERYDFYKQYKDRAIISPVASVHEIDLRGIQPIHLAVERGNFGATFTLIEKFGADINARTRPVANNRIPNNRIPPYSTPLIISIIKNNLEIFHYLLSKADLDKDLGTEQFKTPLHFAAEFGNLEMVEALIARKVKISYLKRTRKSAFHLALASCNVQVAKWLAERNLGVGPVCSDTSNYLESIFHFLARQKLPIDTWIEMLRVCENAVMENKPPDVRFIDRRALNGMTPLHVAIEEENHSAIAGLILSGADISQTTLSSTGPFRTPFIKAVNEFFGKIPISPDVVNNENESIWHLCARYDAVHLLQGVVYLFPEKSNLHGLNSNGLTALDLAFELHNFSVALELIKLHEHVIQINVLESLASSAAWNCWPELLESLIQEFPSDFAFIMSPASSLTLLHIIATEPVRHSSKINPKNIVLLLIKNYPHIIQSYDKLGRTPLHLALECEYLEFFDWLVEAKLSNPDLDFNVFDDKGKSFSDLLKEMNETSLLNLLKLE